MGWFEWLSGTDQPEGARNASVAERVEMGRYLSHNPPLKSDEAFRWEGGLFTGYHLKKVEKSGSPEYVKRDESGSEPTSG